MSSFAAQELATASLPEPINTTHGHSSRPSLSPTASSSASSVSSSSESEQTSARPVSRKSRADRPWLSERQRSSSLIVPKGRMNSSEQLSYPPDDARAMSPRRNSQDLEKLERDIRQSLKDQARTLQSSLAALAEKIDEVKQDHDKLESENRFLQDYIGGLTRNMSRENNPGRSTTKTKGRR